MEFDKKQMIEQLKLEIQVIEKGGYEPSVREPRKEPRIFRDSVSCLNPGLEEKKEPCDHCYLMEFVPPEHRDKVAPCHYIPFDERGDTVKSLEGRRDLQQAALLNWLHATLARLEKEVARSK
jgi:hypothetical protein